MVQQLASIKNLEKKQGEKAPNFVNNNNKITAFIKIPLCALQQRTYLNKY